MKISAAICREDFRQRRRKNTLIPRTVLNQS